ncbi:MAG: L,D-transpeptidase family protein [Pseudomonadota bacterium]
MPLLTRAVGAVLLAHAFVLLGPSAANAVEPGAPEELLSPQMLVSEAIEQRITTAAPVSADEASETALRKFYAERDFRPLWVTGARLGRAAERAMDEIAKADTYALDPSAFKLPSRGGDRGVAALAADDLMLTRAVLLYAVHARGGRIDPRKLSAYLDRGAYPVPPAEVLEAVSSNSEPDAYLRSLQPQHPEFKRLRARYLELLADEGQAVVKIPRGPTLKPGMRHRQVALLRERLGVPAPQPAPDLFEGVEQAAANVDDLSASEDTANTSRLSDEELAAEAARRERQRTRQIARLQQTYDDALVSAVRAFQKKNSLKVDGIVGPGTRKALNGDGVALKQRLAVNMERWRWMPQDLGDYYIWANVPDYTFYVVRNGEVVHTERAIVGKYGAQTATFSDELEEIVFNPRWYVPPSIKEFDLRSASAIRRKGLRVQRGGRYIDPGSVDWSTANMSRYNIYQPSGPGNALGKLKFLFPNKHAIYMHDTPSKGLFNRSWRAFSAGCVRVRDPKRFAEILLGYDQGFTAADIRRRIAGGKRSSVLLKNKVPVHITYFTARADVKVAASPDGIRTLQDVYRHDGRIARALAGKKVPYIAQNALSGKKRVRRAKVVRKKKKNPFWFNNVFGLN